VQPLESVLAFYGIRRLIIAFTRALQRQTAAGFDLIYFVTVDHCI
jgi:2,4-dienoyl-CoA reductase-like NADH-dependent reductase (Old Yellow Enzyme family)